MILTTEIKFNCVFTSDIMRIIHTERYARIENHVAGYIRFTFETENYYHLKTSICKLFDALPECQITCTAKNRTPRYDPVKDYIRRGPLALSCPQKPQPEPVRWDLRFLNKYATVKK